MNKQRGMSMIELVVVMVVVTILSTIAIGSYRRYTLRASRVEATTTLLQVRVEQEKFFLQNGRFASSMAEVTTAPPNGLGIALGAGNVTVGGGKYTISLASPTNTTYTVTATATGSQTADSGCLTYTINESGTRTPATATGCWR